MVAQVQVLQVGSHNANKYVLTCQISHSDYTFRIKSFTISTSIFVLIDFPLYKMWIYNGFTSSLSGVISSHVLCEHISGVLTSFVVTVMLFLYLQMDSGLADCRGSISSRSTLR